MVGLSPNLCLETKMVSGHKMNVKKTKQNSDSEN